MGSSKMKKSIEVILSPALLKNYELKGKTVVIIDILRATTSICVAFQTGVKKIVPVSTPEESMMFRDFDFLCAAERNAQKVDGFDLGNSPFEYQNPLLKDASIAMTTTNGTKAIKLSKESGAAKIVIGAFLNLQALSDYLIKDNNDVVLLCAGWKDKTNLEDTLYAGAVVKNIKEHFEINCDSALMAETIYQVAENKLEEVVLQSAHAKRFSLLHGNFDDVKFCVQLNTLDIIPIMVGEYLVKMNQQ